MLTMTSQKDFKRLVRARMQKTGESYTAARAKLLAKPARSRTTKRASATKTPATKPPAEYAKLAGMSDAVVKEKTGCQWDRWVKSLDRNGAAEMPHREIVALVQTKYKVGDWWAQMVTVGYERIKGLRARGQRRDGSYEATKSRTFDVPIAALHHAFADAATRRKWLADTSATVRTSTPPKSIRLGFDDGSIVAVGFTSKGDARSMAALSHAKLKSKDEVEAVKNKWGEWFDRLVEVVE
jgi:hypothetical protein